jgi:hypothetical protein
MAEKAAIAAADKKVAQASLPALISQNRVAISKIVWRGRIARALFVCRTTAPGYESHFSKLPSMPSPKDYRHHPFAAGPLPTAYFAFSLGLPELGKGSLAEASIALQLLDI